MFSNIWKGALIGIANVIPGVSGGTLALILGIYERLTEAIGEFFDCTHKKRMEYIVFLSQIAVGVVGGILLFSKLIKYLFENHYEGTSFLFLGLIVASLPAVIHHRKKISPTRGESVLFLLGGAIPLAFFFYNVHYGNTMQAMIAGDMTPYYMGKLIFCGVMAGGAMIIPGISGSLLLILLGEYANIVGFVSDFKVVPIGLVGVGAVLGIVLFAKVMDKLLKRYHDETLYFVLGIITFSLIEVWPGITMDTMNILRDLAAFGAGVFLVKSIRSR